MRTETSKANYIAKAGLIAALYAGLCLALQSISFGPIQVRVANALMILPYFTSAAIPGLYVQGSGQECPRQQRPCAKAGGSAVVGPGTKGEALRPSGGGRWGPAVDQAEGGA